MARVVSKTALLELVKGLRARDVKTADALLAAGLFALQWSRFASAAELLKLGADANFRSPKGVTRLSAARGRDRRGRARLRDRPARAADGPTRLAQLRVGGKRGFVRRFFRTRESAEVRWLDGMDCWL